MRKHNTWDYKVGDLIEVIDTQSFGSPKQIAVVTKCLNLDSTKLSAGGNRVQKAWAYTTTTGVIRMFFENDWLMSNVTVKVLARGESVQ